MIPSDDPDKTGFTVKDLIRWGVILFTIAVYLYFYLKILFLK